MTSAARGRLQIKGVSSIAGRFTDLARIAPLGFRFPSGSSGPWGDDIPGAWLTFADAKSVYLRERRAYFRSKRPLYSFWYDWHATY